MAPPWVHSAKDQELCLLEVAGATTVPNLVKSSVGERNPPMSFAQVTVLPNQVPNILCMKLKTVYRGIAEFLATPAADAYLGGLPLAMIYLAGPQIFMTSAANWTTR